VKPALALREIALAGVALLAVVVALAIAAVREDAGEAALPASVPVAGEGWYRALAAPYRVERVGDRTTCGHEATPKTLGVAHPVLPCGAKVYIAFRGKQILTQVIDRGTGVPGREFDVTTALAKLIGLRGTKRIEWRFADRPRNS
jgi:rare lipoprotein A (peptidoglycan hydrolase)